MRYRHLVVVGVLLAILGAPPVAPAAGADAPGAARQLTVSALWEDVLLLEAVRWVRLSPAQWQEMAPLAVAAAGRLERLREQETETLAALERIARESRQALVTGGRGSARDAGNALQHQETLRRRRAQAEREVADHVTPRLARLLSREQLARVYRLVLGEPPRPGEEAPSPALLDPNAGFVATDRRPPEWTAREAVVRSLRGQARARQEAARAAAAPRGGPGGETALGAAQKKPIDPVLVWEVDQVAVARKLAVARDTLGPTEGVLRKKAPPAAGPASGAPSLAAPGDAELLTALRFFAQRLFLSPRLEPVLRERLAAP